MKKLVYGIGLNDADYPVTLYERVDGKSKAYWVCPYYRKWQGMLERGSGALLHRHPSYLGVTVCEEWKLFSTFRKWMETQKWEGLELDKDVLVIGNKFYSPETCVFVPCWINTLLIDNKGKRGDLPLGVNIAESKINPYRAQVCNVLTNKNKHLGLFPTPEAAHKAWKRGKADQILIALDMYLKEESFRQDVYDSLFNHAYNLFTEGSL